MFLPTAMHKKLSVLTAIIRSVYSNHKCCAIYFQYKINIDLILNG